jgi:hypothetical protein
VGRGGGVPKKTAVGEVGNFSGLAVRIWYEIAIKKFLEEAFSVYIDLPTSV